MYPYKPKSMDNVYRKHNSFAALHHKDENALTKCIERIRKLSAHGDMAMRISQDHQRVLAIVLGDIFSKEQVNSRPRFVLTPSVAQEMLSYKDDAVLPRYLVHRYRYEMYPQLRELDNFPPYLQIEPTAVCNFRCVFCYQTDKTFSRKSSGYTGHMPLDLFKHIIDTAVGDVEFISLASRGEPLLCPDIVPMLAYTRGKFLNLKLNTNAALLDERKCHAILQGGVKTLVISADAAEEPLYSSLRVGGKLSVVLSNVERFQKIRETQYRNSEIITRVSGVKYRDDQDIQSLGSFWGGIVDQVAFVNYNPWENVYLRVPSDIQEPCSDLWRRMFIWWDGRVNVCDVDYKSTLAVGNIRENTLSALWRGSKYSGYRIAHVGGERGHMMPCNRCTVV